MAMRWYARPEGDSLRLRTRPLLASWNKANDSDQIRLRQYLDDTEDLLAASRVEGPWVLRLDVGLPPRRNLLDMADLDNYAYPLAYRLRDPGLVSVWCTKQHSERSFVRIAAAHEVPPPSAGLLIAATTASASTVTYKQQIYAAVAESAPLPTGPVRLQLSFVVGPRRNWLNLWKQTIDSLDPLLGRTNPGQAWHPRDGRITELGMHVSVDPNARDEVVVGIDASSGQSGVGPYDRVDLDDNHRGAHDDASQPYIDEVVGPAPLPETGPGTPNGNLREFRDDDASYLSWLAAHPRGYVINIARNHNVATARIHLADCRTISGQNPHRGPWTGPYVKVCAEYSADLEQWAIDNVHASIPPCGTCRPGSAS